MLIAVRPRSPTTRRTRFEWPSRGGMKSMTRTRRGLQSRSCRLRHNLQWEAALEEPFKYITKRAGDRYASAASDCLKKKSNKRRCSAFCRYAIGIHERAYPTQRGEDLGPHSSVSDLDCLGYGHRHRVELFYKPEWLTWWLRTTMTAIEKACALLPYPWGDRVEIATRGIGASFWIQITLAIIIVRVIAWMIGFIWRHSR